MKNFKDFLSELQKNYIDYLLSKDNKYQDLIIKKNIIDEFEKQLPKINNLYQLYGFLYKINGQFSKNKNKNIQNIIEKIKIQIYKVENNNQKKIQIIFFLIYLKILKY